MSTLARYPIPIDRTEWHVRQDFETTFRWEYEDGRDELLNLCAKGELLHLGNAAA